MKPDGDDFKARFFKRVVKSKMTYDDLAMLRVAANRGITLDEPIVQWLFAKVEAAEAARRGVCIPRSAAHFEALFQFLRQVGSNVQGLSSRQLLELQGLMTTTSE